MSGMTHVVVDRDNKRICFEGERMTPRMAMARSLRLNEEVGFGMRYAPMSADKAWALGYTNTGTVGSRNYRDPPGRTGERK